MLQYLIYPIYGTSEYEVIAMEEDTEMEMDKGVAEETTRSSKERKMDDNTVYIGKKDLMSYVLAVVTQFNNGENEVIIKARGRAISRAVDAAEIARQRFLPDVVPKDIKIGTEQIQGDEGPVRVSSMEITLGKR